MTKSCSTKHKRQQGVGKWKCQHNWRSTMHNYSIYIVKYTDGLLKASEFWFLFLSPEFGMYICQNPRAHFLNFSCWVQLLSARLDHALCKGFPCGRARSAFPCTACMQILRRIWWHTGLSKKHFIYSYGFDKELVDICTLHRLHNFWKATLDTCRLIANVVIWNKYWYANN